MGRRQLLLRRGLVCRQHRPPGLHVFYRPSAAVCLVRRDPWDDIVCVSSPRSEVPPP